MPRTHAAGWHAQHSRRTRCARLSLLLSELHHGCANLMWKNNTNVQRTESCTYTCSSSSVAHAASHGWHNANGDSARDVLPYFSHVCRWRGSYACLRWRCCLSRQTSKKVPASLVVGQLTPPCALTRDEFDSPVTAVRQLAATVHSHLHDFFFASNISQFFRPARRYCTLPS